MTILFYSNMGLAPAHLGTELELIKHHQDTNDEIHIIKCDGGLQSCFFNPCHSLIGCSICSTRSAVFHKKLRVKKENIHFLAQDKSPLPTTLQLDQITNLEQLKKVSIEGINIGRGVASSVISLERDYNLEHSKRRTDLIKVQMEMAYNALLSFKKILNKVKPDLVYLFNGRFTSSNVLVELCTSNKVPYTTYERGATYQKYQLFENTIPHSIEYRGQLMADLWNQASPEHIEQASNWFEKKIKGTEAYDKSYTKAQEKGKLPPGFDPSKTNIAIFNSSEDEFKTIEEWQHDLFINQNDAIVNTVRHYKNNPTFHFYLRVHPNLKKLKNQQVSELALVNEPNLTIIKAEETIDSYALLFNCDKVLTFGSTMGLEATFHQKPSILFGRSYYEKLGATYNPSSYQALFELLENAELPPLEKENALPFANFFLQFGTLHQYFLYDGKFNSSFEKEKIKRIYFQTIIDLINRFPDLPTWKKMNVLVLGRKLSFKDLFVLKSHTIENS